MRRRDLGLYLIGCFGVVGCSQNNHARPHEITDDIRSTVTREVTSVIHGYMAGFTAARCDDVTPVSKFVADGMLFATSSKIVHVPLADTEQELRDMVCGWASHTGTVDSVVVDVLSPHIAVAAWLYHDEVTLKSGETKQYKGSALMTLVHSVDGWKITSTMAAYE